MSASRHWRDFVSKTAFESFRFSLLHWTNNCPCVGMSIHADTDRGDLRRPDEIRSTISCCLKATRSECPKPFYMDNCMRRVISRRVRYSPQLAILVLVLSFTVRATTPQLISIPIPGTKAFPEASRQGRTALSISDVSEMVGSSESNHTRTKKRFSSNQAL